MAREFDLLGDPIPENKGNPGANGHVATSENINKVRHLVIAKWTSAQIAEELGITVPTLNKHYFRNTSIKRARNLCVAEARGRVMMLLDEQAAKGNVAAIKELGKIVEKAALEDVASNIGSGKPKTKPLGKKQQTIQDARAILDGKPKGTGGFLPAYDKGRAH